MNFKSSLSDPNEQLSTMALNLCFCLQEITDLKSGHNSGIFCRLNRIMHDKLLAQTLSHGKHSGALLYYCYSPSLCTGSQKGPFRNIFHCRGQQRFSGKGQRVNVCFAGRANSGVSTHLCGCAMKGALGGTRTNHHVSAIEASLANAEI